MGEKLVKRGKKIATRIGWVASAGAMRKFDDQVISSHATLGSPAVSVRVLPK